MPTQQEVTLESLNRMQQFKSDALSRERDLGNELNFKDVLPVAERLVALYQQISSTVIEDLPLPQLTTLQTRADEDFQHLNRILQFSVKQGDPHNVRSTFIKQVKTAHEETFKQLIPIISYSTSKSAQKIEDKAAESIGKLEEAKTRADQILEDIRKVAAQQGVSQQAIYFRDTAQNHETQASVWQDRIYMFAGILGIYAVGTLFLHKWSWIKPDDVYQTAQLAISKVLIFGVLSYLLYLATKNYLAHKHNSVVNKHRQNALMTYEAIVNAAKGTANTEVILTHASSCIFAPQQTGYSGATSPDGPVAKSFVELLGGKTIGQE